jgi:hypothetical protein
MARTRPATARRSDTKILAVTSLVCGILAFFVAGVILGLIAVVLGWFALRSSSRLYRTPALIGTILGALAFTLAVIILATNGGWYVTG